VDLLREVREGDRRLLPNLQVNPPLVQSPAKLLDDLLVGAPPTLRRARGDEDGSQLRKYRVIALDLVQQALDLVPFDASHRLTAVGLVTQDNPTIPVEI
jgi:hypothetical protein